MANFINIRARMHLNKNIILYQCDSMSSVMCLQCIYVLIIYAHMTANITSYAKKGLKTFLYFEQIGF